MACAIHLGRHVIGQETPPLVDSAGHISYAEIPQADGGQHGRHCPQQDGLLGDNKGGHPAPRDLDHNLQPPLCFRLPAP